MNDAAKESWSKSFLKQEELVENLARMASITQDLCFATFGQSAPEDDRWEDALFTIRHLVSMIEDFQNEYLAAISAGSCKSS
jgi:hypothetical protein